ncbi:MAG: hypothetical protein DHS20C21_07990 [Gemmatimonadota bacterium]|nr:MAG: hypothetical protein DHS20C21_07990 [Gemmatimonadota bacterium]
MLVMPGVYAGNVMLKSGVALIGSAGAGATTVDAGGASVCIEGHNVTESIVQGLRLTGVTHSAYSYTGAAGLEASGDLEVRDCVIEHNYAVGGGIHGSGDLRVFGTRFSSNAGGTDAVDAGAIQWEEGSAFIQGCVFEQHSDGLIRAGTHEFTFVDNTVRDNGLASFGFRAFFVGPSSATVKGNLFVNNAVSVEDWSSDPQLVAEFRGNTCIRSPAVVGCEQGGTIENNLFTGSSQGLKIWGSHSRLDIRCNNSWGNDVNWIGFPDPTGTDGNISAPPLLCDWMGGNFALSENSPCLPENNSCGVQMGVHGVGCGPVSIQPESWARVKARYR